jgi:hypothetical protein
MDCKTAHLLLEYAGARNSELDAGEASALKEHLAECPDCVRLARMDRAAADRLGEAMRAVPVPPGLRDRLLARLESEHDPRRRRLFGARTRWAAAAAAVILALSFGLLWQIHHARPIDLEELSYKVWEQTANPSAESVREWFLRETKLAITPPPHFDYRLLTHYYLADLYGEKVPLLLFTNRSLQARVYVVSDKQFKLKNLAPSGGSGCTSVVSLFDNGHSAYLILFTGESLEPFLSKESPEAL